MMPPSSSPPPPLPFLLLLPYSPSPFSPPHGALISAVLCFAALSRTSSSSTTGSSSSRCLPPALLSCLPSRSLYSQQGVLLHAALCIALPRTLCCAQQRRSPLPLLTWLLSLPLQYHEVQAPLTPFLEHILKPLRDRGYIWGAHAGIEVRGRGITRPLGAPGAHCCRIV